MSSADWTSGYVTDINYTFGYFPQLNPLNIKLLFLNSGIRPPEITTACELGFGQGVSVNIHAAGSPVKWWGTDFNPSQAGFAQELANASGADVTLKDDSFEEFLNRDDLPGFDYIALHGIWSWISDENRKHIVNFINKNLNIGGVVYISYNIQPGWAAMSPLRDLMFEYSKTILASGDPLVNRVEDSIAFCNDLMESGAGFFKLNPSVKDKIEGLKSFEKNYLVHEYFDGNWNPMLFSEIAESLNSSKLTFVCSATPVVQLSGLNFTPDQIQLINKLHDPVFKETTKDFILNTQFRKDFWIKGKRFVSKIEQLEFIRDLRVVLAVPREDVKYKLGTGLGEVSLDPLVYDPILDILNDNKPKSIRQIESLLNNNKTIPLSNVVEALMILSNSNYVQPAQENSEINKIKKNAAKLNRFLCERSKGSLEIVFLVSPVTGGGICVNRIQQLFLLDYESGVKDPNQLAENVFQLLKSQNQNIISDGKEIETDEETSVYLKKHAESFLSVELPVFKALMIRCKL